MGEHLNNPGVNPIEFGGFRNLAGHEQCFLKIQHFGPEKTDFWEKIQQKNVK